jgi:hypothetical protein
MAHTVITQATVPGTTATITIENHPGNNNPFVVVGHAPTELGGNWSCGRSTEQEARATANDHWKHIVGLRDSQEIPGLPGVTVADAATLSVPQPRNPHYGEIKQLRRELADQLAAIVPQHEKYRVAVSLPGEGGKIRFFRVDTPLRGTWRGAVFLKEQAGDDFHKVKGVAREEMIINVILKDPRAALKLYGLELGSCGICGRTLTDEESRALGIGPVCADKAMGF